MEFNFDLDQEISEHPFDPVQRDYKPTANPLPRRGQPALQDLWTRVISVRHDGMESIEYYELRSEFLLAK